MASLRTLSHSLQLARHVTLRSCATRTTTGTQRIRTFAVAAALREKYFTKSHEWIELDGDKKTGSIGISAHAADALGDIVFVELPPVDKEVAAGDTMGAVESVKSASDLYVPVAGTIIEANSKLDEKPGLINQSPETDGWIAKIRLADGEAERVSELMNAEDYKKFSE